jgi:hypothetical protein
MRCSNATHFRAVGNFALDGTFEDEHRRYPKGPWFNVLSSSAQTILPGRLRELF